MWKKNTQYYTKDRTNIYNKSYVQIFTKYLQKINMCLASITLRLHDLAPDLYIEDFQINWKITKSDVQGSSSLNTGFSKNPPFNGSYYSLAEVSTHHFRKNTTQTWYRQLHGTLLG